jgi:glutaredoxin
MTSNPSDSGAEDLDSEGETAASCYLNAEEEPHMRFFGFGKRRPPAVPPRLTTPSTQERDAGRITSAAQEIVVYGTTDGTRCRQVRALLEKQGYTYKDIRVDEDLGTRSWLQRTTGDDALPKVFVGTKCYGGFEDIQVLAFDGRLERLVHGETLQGGPDDDVAALKRDLSPASLIVLLRRGEILTIREGGMETDAWVEPLANPPAVYYEGSPHPLTELERIAGDIITRLKNREIEVHWKEKD